jgi:hypothetical protein
MNRFDIALEKPIDIEDLISSKEINYGGWIDKRVASRDELIAMGVKGEIKLSSREKEYEYCYITEKIAKILMKKSRYFFAGAFTALDAMGNQLPRDQQKLWGYLPGETFQVRNL